MQHCIEKHLHRSPSVKLFVKSGDDDISFHQIFSFTSVCIEKWQASPPPVNVMDECHLAEARHAHWLRRGSFDE